MQSLEQRLQLVEVFQPRDIFVADVLTFFPGHTRIMRAVTRSAIPLMRGWLECTNLVPNRIAPVPLIVSLWDIKTLALRRLLQYVVNVKALQVV